MSEPSSFYKTEQALSSAQKKKLKKKQKQYLEQLDVEEHIDSKIKVGQEEFDAIQSKLFDLGFKIHNIQPDGNCLFKSIEHQLSHLSGSGLAVQPYSFSQLRALTVAFLRENSSEFKHFIASSSDNSDPDDAFDAYCSRMERDGEWGSELELQAMSRLLGCRITVFNAANEIEYGSEGPFDINISFHRHQYVLGPHYNSVVPF